MACYCNRRDIQTRIPELKEQGGNPKTDDQVDESIREAQTEIDSTLGSLHTVPFVNPIPPMVRSIAAYLAAAFLLDSGFSGGAETTELAKHYRDLAHKRLAAIVDGELLLYPADPDAESEEPGFYAYHSGELPVLGSFNPYAV